MKKFSKLVEDEADAGMQKVDTFANRLDSELEWFIETSRLFSNRSGVDHKLHARRLRAQLQQSIDRLLPKT